MPDGNKVPDLYLLGVLKDIPIAKNAMAEEGSLPIDLLESIVIELYKRRHPFMWRKDLASIGIEIEDTNKQNTQP